MLIAMLNLAPTPSPYFTSGLHFHETTRFFPKWPETQTHGDSKVYFLLRQTWLSLHTANILPSHVQQHTLLSQLSHNSISSLYFFPFPRGLQHKDKLYFPCCQLKTIPKNISTSYILELLSFIYLTTISAEITHLARKQLNVNTHTHVTTFPR